MFPLLLIYMGAVYRSAMQGRDSNRSPFQTFHRYAHLKRRRFQTFHRCGPFKSFNLNTEASSRRSKRSTALLRSNRLNRQNLELRNSGILEMRNSHYLRWFPRAMHREVELVGGTYALQGREFAPENEVLTLKNTIPWQRFAATAKTKPGP